MGQVLSYVFSDESEQQNDKCIDEVKVEENVERKDTTAFNEPLDEELADNEQEDTLEDVLDIEDEKELLLEKGKELSTLEEPVIFEEKIEEQQILVDNNDLLDIQIFKLQQEIDELENKFLDFKESNEFQKYGWNKDLPDHRDHVHQSNLLKISTVIDLRDKCPQVYNQGKLGSCTANAIAFAYQFDEIKQEEKSDFAPSRLFIYYNERKMEGNVKKDSGAAIRDGIKSINTIGVCPEKYWKYNIDKFTDEPPSSCYEIAEFHKSVKYRRVKQTPYFLKSALSENLPIVFGFTVYESFESDKVKETGVVPMPNTQTEKLLGGHAVALVGYTNINDKNYFIVRNSWGEEWGDKGYCYMPEEFICDSEQCSDFWVVEKIRDNTDENIFCL